MTGRGGLFPGLAALCVLLFFGSLLIGPAGIGPGAALSALFAGGDDPLALVMREIRLPRALLGLLTGASLVLAGAAMQGYLRNPLAEPGLIGVSGLAPCISRSWWAWPRVS